MSMAAATMHIGRFAGVKQDFGALRRWLPALLVRSLRHRQTDSIPVRTFLKSPCKRLCNRGYTANKCSVIRKVERFSYSLRSSSQHVFSTKANDILSLDSTEVLQYLEHLVWQHSAATQKLISADVTTDEEIRRLNNAIVRLGPLIARFEQFKEKRMELDDLSAIMADETCNDLEMMEMAKAEQDKVKEKMEELEQQILMMLVPYGRADEHDIIVEVTAGIGGKEAMLFTNEIFNMYTNYAAFKGWAFDVIAYDRSEMGGLRKASASITGQEVYRHLKFEVGVHRVQRVPQTEKSGRIHTSTMTVAVLPQPTEIDIQINPKDLRIDTFKASGSGGQHVNKTDSAVRIVHLPSGTVVECQEGRSQLKNKATAMNLIRSKLYQKELTEQENAIKTKRKLQVGTGARSDKIRTYNFNQDRVTDHRIGYNMHNLNGFLVGGEDLDEMIDGLLTESQREQLLELLLEHKDTLESTKSAAKSR